MKEKETEVKTEEKKENNKVESKTMTFGDLDFFKKLKQDEKKIKK